MKPSRQQVALVTGAAKRIGRTIALALAQDGWDIAVHYGNSQAEALLLVDEIIALGRRAIALQCELADEAGVRKLVARAEQIGPLRCVVNNASIFQHDLAENFQAASLDLHMRANVAAPILLAHALFAATPAGQQSVVINLLDQKLYNPNPDFLSYTLSKAALHSATTLLAQALAPRVRVVGVAPGITMVSGDQSSAEFDKAHGVTPLGKSSTPADVAAAVCFVATASAMTGTTLLVDGGQHLIPLQRDIMFIAK